ncbi:MAG: hydrogenase maturation protease [Flavobacteriaceae bacterium]|nr:hydrogenase maturation protease [Flavobacteriaceae bacterium]
MSETDKYNCLVFGIGNSGRQDDGLGWAFLEALDPNQFENIKFEYRFQLQIEDAELISKYEKVIFVDAFKNELSNGFKWENCQSSNQYSFSTHALVPETILYLSENLYNHSPKARILAIQGYGWELRNGLTIQAEGNLKNALKFFKTLKL